MASYVGSDSAGAGDAIVTGCSMGAYHALQLALHARRPVPGRDLPVGQLRPVDLARAGATAATRRTSPTPPTTSPTSHGDHLDWLRSRLHVVLTVGQGAWETHPTGSLPSARRMGHLLAEKQISHELDVWGHDVSHDWPWWQARSPTTCRATADPASGPGA